MPGQRFVINYVFNIVHMRWFHPIEQMEKFAKGRLVPLILDRLQQSNANGASKVASMSWYAFQTMVASFVLYLGRDYVALSIDTAKSPWAPEPSTDSSNGTPVSDSAERPKDALDSQKLANYLTRAMFLGFSKNCSRGYAAAMAAHVAFKPTALSNVASCVA